MTDDAKILIGKYYTITYPSNRVPYTLPDNNPPSVEDIIKLLFGRTFIKIYI